MTAAVSTRHRHYAQAQAKWQRMRDVIAGQDAVHARGEAYLPRLSAQSDSDYEAYKLRATWFGATSRTVDALHGLLFRKLPTITADGMDEILGDITMDGTPALGFGQRVAREVLEMGRVGILVDYPVVQAMPSSLGAAIAAGARPFATMYAPESILNWRVERIGNRMATTLVVLAEAAESIKSEFESDVVTQYRVLSLSNGVYVQRVYREGDAGAALVAETVPLMRGVPMREIPFVAVGPEHIGFDVSDPPLIDMADLNLSHYRTTADLEHGAHYTGLPMLFLAGVQLDEGATVPLGSQVAVTSPHSDANGRFIEFTGQGLGALESLVARKEAQMAALGASMLAQQKRGVEAAQTYEMRVAQETSMLADVAQQVSAGMTRVLGWMRDWAGVAGDVAFEVSTDYTVTRMTAGDLSALMALWQSGGISRQTLYWNLQQGELIAPGKTLEDELDEIQADGPAPGREPADADGE